MFTIFFDDPNETAHEWHDRIFGAEIMAIMRAKVGEPSEVINTGGGSMVAVYTLADNTIITLNEECAVHHRDIEEFWCEDGEYSEYSEIGSVGFWDDLPYRKAHHGVAWDDATTARVTDWIDRTLTASLASRPTQST
jgi:hypothetical protein